MSNMRIICDKISTRGVLQTSASEVRWLRASAFLSESEWSTEHLIIKRGKLDCREQSGRGLVPVRSEPGPASARGTAASAELSSAAAAVRRAVLPQAVPEEPHPVAVEGGRRHPQVRARPPPARITHTTLRSRKHACGDAHGTSSRQSLWLRRRRLEDGEAEPSGSGVREGVRVLSPPGGTCLLEHYHSSPGWVPASEGLPRSKEAVQSAAPTPWAHTDVENRTQALCLLDGLGGYEPELLQHSIPARVGSPGLGGGPHQGRKSGLSGLDSQLDTHLPPNLRPHHHSSTLPCCMQTENHFLVKENSEINETKEATK